MKGKPAGMGDNNNNRKKGSVIEIELGDSDYSDDDVAILFESQQTPSASHRRSPADSCVVLETGETDGGDGNGVRMEVDMEESSTSGVCVLQSVGLGLQDSRRDAQAVVTPTPAGRATCEERVFGNEKESEEDELKCEVCPSGRPATAYCPVCPTIKHLCEECAEQHTQAEAWDNHVVSSDLVEQMANLKAMQRKQSESAKSKVKVVNEVETFDIGENSSDTLTSRENAVTIESQDLDPMTDMNGSDVPSTHQESNGQKKRKKKKTQVLASETPMVSSSSDLVVGQMSKITLTEGEEAEPVKSKTDVARDEVETGDRDLAQKENSSDAPASTSIGCVAGIAIENQDPIIAKMNESDVPSAQQESSGGKKFKRKKKKKKAVQSLPPVPTGQWSVVDDNRQPVKDSKYSYSCHVKEKHGKALYGVKFHLNLGPGQPLIFATVGSNRVTIYECLPDGSIKLLQCFADKDPEENFYACAWSDDDSGSPILAAAGFKGIIRIFSPASATAIKTYTAHTSAINDLMFHPKDKNILVSGSKDLSVRLWNVRTNACAVKFGGCDGHRDEVISVDIDLTGSKLLSCGMDHSIRIWNLYKPQIANKIRQSSAFKSMSNSVFPTYIQNCPDFVTRNVHHNYIDCGKWFGQFIISKSCENEILCWKGGDISQDWNEVPYVSIDEVNTRGGEVSVLAEFEIEDCDIWYIRFSLDHWKKKLALGNVYGKTYVYDLKEDSPHHIKGNVLSHPSCTSLVRQTAFSRDGTVLLCVCDDATIWRWNIDRKEEEEAEKKERKSLGLLNNNNNVPQKKNRRSRYTGWASNNSSSDVNKI